MSFPSATSRWRRDFRGTGQATDYYALYSPYNPAGASYYTPASTWTPATLGYGWNTTLYGQNPGLYTDITQDQCGSLSATTEAFGSEQASMFNDRLHLMLGGRSDYVRNHGQKLQPSRPWRLRLYHWWGPPVPLPASF